MTCSNAGSDMFDILPVSKKRVGKHSPQRPIFGFQMLDILDCFQVDGVLSAITCCFESDYRDALMAGRTR